MKRLNGVFLKYCTIKLERLNRALLPLELLSINPRTRLTLTSFSISLLISL